MAGAVALVVTAGVAVSIAAAPSGYLRPGRTERVSVSSSGAQADYPVEGSIGVTGNGDLSADGRYAVFTSPATNLVPGDTNAMADIFRHDRRTGQTIRVSMADDGSQALPGVRKDCVNCGGGGAVQPTVSADGRYVAFVSYSSNLVAGDTNLLGDVFVRDTRLNRTIRVSVSSQGGQADGNSFYPVISASGRFVAFTSNATNLDPRDKDTNGDIYVRDLIKKTTALVSVASDGTKANSNSEHVSISGDGKVIAFESFADNLAPGPSAAQLAGVGGQIIDVFSRNLVTGKTVRVTTASDGTYSSFTAFPNCKLICGQAMKGPRSLSDDGRYVVFVSNATNLVPNDSNFSPSHGFGNDVFLKDLVTNRTERISTNSYGQEKADPSSGGAIASGRFVAYYTDALRCDAPLGSLPKTAVDSDGVCYLADGYLGVANMTIHTQDEDTFVYDRETGVMDKVSVTPAGSQPAKGSCSSGEAALGMQAIATRSLGLSSDGRYALMASSAQNLVPGDTNNRCDYFVRDRGATLGVGGWTGAVPASSQPPGCGLPVCPPIPVEAGLQQARVSPRQGLQDLFIRWDVSSMAPVEGAPFGGLLYELRFTSGGQHYAVRAQRVPGSDFDQAGGASFGLFCETASGAWTHVASLKGGYGTIGDSVVTAVPLSLIAGKAQLTDVTAYTAVGSYLSGATKVLESLRLSR